jgi:hypothetical protein
VLPAVCCAACRAASRGRGWECERRGEAAREGQRALSWRERRGADGAHTVLERSGPLMHGHSRAALHSTSFLNIVPLALLDVLTKVQCANVPIYRLDRASGRQSTNAKRYRNRASHEQNVGGAQWCTCDQPRLRSMRSTLVTKGSGEPLVASNHMWNTYESLH